MVIVTPFPDFSLSCKVMETRRLVDMIDEIHCLVNGVYATVAQSSTKSAEMWRNAPNALADYGNYMNKELYLRGEPGVLLDPFLFRLTRIPYSLPWWFGKPQFHATHRRFLSMRNPEHYNKYWPYPTAGQVQMWPKHAPQGPTQEDVLGV
jgi:hypothetical protein